MKFVAIFVLVFVVSIVQLFVAAPLGFWLDLPWYWNALAVFLGGMLGISLLVYYTDPILEFVSRSTRRLLRRPVERPAQPEEPEEESQPGWFGRAVDRFGAPFLGILGPLTIGGWGSAILGRANGIPRVRLVVWLAVGQGLVSFGYVFSLGELVD